MSRTLHWATVCCLLVYLLPFNSLADDEVKQKSQTSVSDSAATDTDTVEDDTSKKKDETVMGVDKQSDTTAGTDIKTDSETDTTITTTTATGKPTDINEKLKTAILQVQVVQKGEGDQPIKNARVIITYEDATEYERKTDASGKAMLTGLPYGKVDVDVTSSGRQSDGGTLVLDEPKETLTFHLKPRNHTDQ